jgi:hypothetical protein
VALGHHRAPPAGSAQRAERGRHRRLAHAALAGDEQQPTVEQADVGYSSPSQ